MAINGQVLQSKQVDANGLLIDLTDVEAGLYLIEMQVGAERIVEKLTVK